MSDILTSLDKETWHDQRPSHKPTPPRIAQLRDRIDWLWHVHNFTLWDAMDKAVKEYDDVAQAWIWKKLAQCARCINKATAQLAKARAAQLDLEVVVGVFSPSLPLSSDIQI